ncbi:sugar ABC transporter ATP-binding protein [Schaalia sp. ZJ405]|uniref:ATP-binding cassette domain-containing protein n=1 Tax=unclassified Schaalia TaxID=2691889 RepID=UPI0013EDBB50|nr:MULTISPECIES: ATP-binding cassette domain-containing protein [unclassified Schaalia]QPK81803.1 sugar ABC transporter ATP-binding protein [Schaalia sp. ZJ405]
MNTPAPLLQMSNVTKRFGGVEALAGVDLTVNAREVVALVGDNAAGKSTLARMISGVHQPSSGIIRIEGEPVVIPTTQIAIALGVATVFQELALCDNLDVVSNIFLGQEHTQGAFLDEDEMALRAREYLDQLNSKIPDVSVPLRSLSAGQRQCVAIARTLVSNPRLVVLDEPTASLSVGQTAEVLTHIERLRDMGLGVLFISHNLTDVKAVSDRVEVLRHGRNNGSFDAQDASIETIIAAITGATRVRRSS